MVWRPLETCWLNLATSEFFSSKCGDFDTLFGIPPPPQSPPKHTQLLYLVLGIFLTTEIQCEIKITNEKM
jgi:hypothetical protein